LGIEGSGKKLNSHQNSKMASGGLMCEVPALPKMGHNIETIDFLESLGKSINAL
jgi:hypothetical protein